MEEEKQDDDYDNSRDAKGKAQAYRVVKLQRCNTQKNNNGGSNRSVSVSREGAANKEADRPEYQTRYRGSGENILNCISYAVCSADCGSRGV